MARPEFRNTPGVWPPPPKWDSAALQRQRFLIPRRPAGPKTMKISAAMKKALNAQIAMEAYASSYYLSMASWCETTGYDGSAKMLYAQADEERMHMLKIVRYLNDTGTGASISSISAPPASFKGLEEMFKAALANEQSVTRSFDKMAGLAQKEGDHATFAFLQWFVTEQVEEEKLFETILQKFELLGRDKIGIYEVDKFVGTISLPADAATGSAGA